MAIRLYFLNVIIPIEKINQSKVVGGFSGYIKENRGWLGTKMYHDEYLFRDGAMTQRDVEDIVKFWEKQGLDLYYCFNGPNQWKDLCVVDALGGPTLPCDWIKFDYGKKDDGGHYPYVYLKGKPKGEIVGAKKIKKRLK